MRFPCLRLKHEPQRINPSIPDTCEYDCEPNGKCSVTFASTGPEGNKVSRKGSCFPEKFGGNCFGTPTKCTKCKLKCLNRNGDKFKEEV